MTSTPEVVKVMQGETQVNLQPEWSGTGRNRSFSYSGLPKYDAQGNEYTYSVSEASFTVGSGENAVTYTAVKAADGTYTVTATKREQRYIRPRRPEMILQTVWLKLLLRS